MKTALAWGLSSICVVQFCLAQNLSSEADFYVAVDGNDAWTGKLPFANAGRTDGPFATLSKAQNAVRRLIPTMKSDMVVMIRGGNYFIDHTISFGPADSGRSGHKVIYTSYPGERPMLVGGRLIKGWTRHDENLYRVKLDPAWKFDQLFVDGVRQQKARYPNHDYLIVEKAVEDHAKTQFIYKQGDVPNWMDLRGGQAYVWAGHDWFSNLIPIEKIDRESRTITLTGPTLVDIINQRFGKHSKNRRYYIQGVKEALDVPGEFWRDPDSGELFYRPTAESIEQQQIIAPTVRRIIELIGNDPETPVHDITFRGIDFTISKFTNEFVENRGTHGRTPWNEPANKEGMIYLEHADRCFVEYCDIGNTGYSGISIVWHGQHNRIYGNHIHDCGYHGVLLSGYRADFGVKMDRNKFNVVANNWIHHIGRLVGHGAGIFLLASGHNQVIHNLIHHSPRYGICMKGQCWRKEKFPFVVDGMEITDDNRWDLLHSRNNLFAYNEIFRVSTDTEDNGFISFIAIGKDNVVDHNLLHDNHRTLGGLGMAVYLDDVTDYATVTNNIIYNVEGGTIVMPIYAKGIYNRNENNILVGSDKTKAGISSAAMFGQRADHHIYRRNIFYMVNNAPIYNFWNWSPDRVIECDYIVYYVAEGEVRMKGVPGGDSFDHWRKVNDGKFDAHSVVADPLFVNPEKHDYRLKPESPALKLGFKPIDTSKIGLKDDFPQRFKR
ncbi:MAG: right-handed parallel beta-helix repeat-containing protein [Planctomycetota bacterium]|nr:MAG: right-handed parallel beta-helix repeat-containing protein [Planctomycetota bacterium]